MLAERNEEAHLQLGGDAARQRAAEAVELVA
jgi:hypothetical protein